MRRPGPYDISGSLAFPADIGADIGGDVGIEGVASMSDGVTGSLAGNVPGGLAGDPTDDTTDSVIGNVTGGLPPAGFASALPPLAAGPDHPLVTARRYRELLDSSGAVRARLASRRAAWREDHAEAARRHAQAAADIRSRVENVWSQIAPPLAQYGLSDLDQLRPRGGTDTDALLSQAYEAIGDVQATPPGVRVAGGREKGGGTRGGRPVGEPVALTKPARGLDRGGRRGAEEPPGGAARRDRGRGTEGLAGRAADRAADRAGGRAGGRGSRGDGAGPAVVPPRAEVLGPDGTLDPRQTSKLAYGLCLVAMTRSAELRAVTRSSSELSVGLLTGLACVLTGVVVVVVRVFLEAAALPCLAGGGAVGALIVTAGAKASAVAVVRSALLAAATAGAAVLATFRFVPAEPVGVIASLACLGLAIRFGLGFGGGSVSAGGSGSGRR